MELSLQYAAGFFDGEGCVSLFYTRIRAWRSDPTKVVRGIKLTVLIANSDLKILEQFRAAFGGHINISNKVRSIKHKPVHAWRLTSSRVQEKFLRSIQPYSFVKKYQIDIGLEYLTTAKGLGQRPTQEEWDIRLRCLERMAKLNKRGSGIGHKVPIPTSPSLAYNPAFRG